MKYKHNVALNYLYTEMHTVPVYFSSNSNDVRVRVKQENTE